MKSTESAAPHKVLNSWKEVAHYLERGIRTVQRWEAELGLPVRRPRGKKRSAVIAICAEIDEWVISCPAIVANRNNGQGANNGHAAQTCRIRLRGHLAGQPAVNETILRSRFLRGTVRRSKRELAQAIAQLVGTLKTATEITEGGIAGSHLLLPADCAKDIDAPPTGRIVS